MFPQGRARKRQMTSELGWGGRKHVCTECGNRSLCRLLNAQGRFRGVYLHSLLKPYKTNNHHKNNLIKSRVGEKIATYRRNQQGFRRGEAGDYLHSREQTGANPSAQRRGKPSRRGDKCQESWKGLGMGGARHLRWAIPSRLKDRPRQCESGRSLAKAPRR